MLLDIQNLTKRYDGVLALNDVSFQLNENEILGLIGPNGSGKTTLFNCLNRLCIEDSGDIIFQGHSLKNIPPYKIISLGIARTFQNLALFPGQTVLENILCGAHVAGKSGFISTGLAFPMARKEEQQLINEAEKMSKFFDLDKSINLPLHSLSFVDQKRVELARALMSKPKLLLLDEPAVGLTHEEINILQNLLKSVQKEYKLSILLVEHHMRFIMQISDSVVVLDAGKKIAEGAPSAVQADPEVIKAYLGTNNAAA